MTVIAAAFNSPTDYAIAGDSESQDDNGNRYRTEKVWRWGPILIGCDGYHAIAQRARRYLGTFVSPPTTRDAWVEHLLLLHEEMLHHVGPASPDCPRGIDIRMLTVGPWGIVQMDPMGAVFFPGPYAASGCGGPVALGAMWQWIMWGSPFRDATSPGWPAWIVRNAVDAAIGMNAGCGGTAIVLTSEPPAPPGLSSTTSAGFGTPRTPPTTCGTCPQAPITADIGFALNNQPERVRLEKVDGTWRVVG